MAWNSTYLGCKAVGVLASILMKWFIAKPEIERVVSPVKLVPVKDGLEPRAVFDVDDEWASFDFRRSSRLHYVSIDATRWLLVAG